LELSGTSAPFPSASLQRRTLSGSIAAICARSASLLFAQFFPMLEKMLLRTSGEQFFGFLVVHIRFLSLLFKVYIKLGGEVK
jgi:hypothetical protein